jgi:hypothetical protein
VAFRRAVSAGHWGRVCHPGALHRRERADLLCPAAHHPDGIGEVTTRSDLLDRSILVTLPAIPARDRRDERSFRESFEQTRPYILGALYDALSCALANIGTTHVDELPRMADMALWVTAAEQGLGWVPGTFLSTYRDNHAQGDELALAASPIGTTLRTIADRGFHGTPGQLLQQLNQSVDEAARQASGWPTRPSQVGSEVRRLAPNLRSLGYRIDTPRTNDKRWIILQPSADAVTAVTAVTDRPAAMTDHQPDPGIQDQAAVTNNPSRRMTGRFTGIAGRASTLIPRRKSNRQRPGRRPSLRQ